MKKSAGVARSAFLFVALNGVVLALHRETGREQWRNGLEGGGVGPVALVIGADRLFASADGNRVFCIDARTGDVMWAKKTTGSQRATLVFDEGQLVVAKNGYIDCFSADGELLWSNSMSGLGNFEVAMGFPGNYAQADVRG